MMQRIVLTLDVERAAAEQAMQQALRAVEELLPGKIYRAWRQDIPASTATAEGEES